MEENYAKAITNCQFMDKEQTKLNKVFIKLSFELSKSFLFPNR